MTDRWGQTRSFFSSDPEILWRVLLTETNCFKDANGSCIQDLCLFRFVGLLIKILSSLSLSTRAQLRLQLSWLMRWRLGAGRGPAPRRALGSTHTQPLPAWMGHQLSSRTSAALLGPDILYSAFLSCKKCKSRATWWPLSAAFVCAHWRDWWWKLFNEKNVA